MHGCGVSPRVVPDPPAHGTVVWFTKAPGKWLVRKRNGSWWVWKPYERNPCAQFEGYPPKGWLINV